MNDLIDECDLFWFNSGAGGQGQNKRPANLRLVHIPSGESVVAKGRSRPTNQRRALKELAKRLASRVLGAKAMEKKARRDEAIKPSTAIRTYNMSRGIVKDHRTGKTATTKEILTKGNINLLMDIDGH